MARKVETFTVDDLDGSEGASTVSFGLDGTSYDIDLSAKNADALRESLVEYIAAARKPSGGVKAQGQRTDKAVVQAMREWAAENGHQIKSRGRVPRVVVDAYQAAN